MQPQFEDTWTLWELRGRKTHSRGWLFAAFGPQDMGSIPFVQNLCHQDPSLIHSHLLHQSLETPVTSKD